MNGGYRRRLLRWLSSLEPCRVGEKSTTFGGNSSIARWRGNFSHVVRKSAEKKTFSPLLLRVSHDLNRTSVDKIWEFFSCQFTRHLKAEREESYGSMRPLCLYLFIYLFWSWYFHCLDEKQREARVHKNVCRQTQLVLILCVWVYWHMK